ncbi:MAG TPA: hypothetical protein VHU92_26380 [Streptosporangiaceae bacterium]|jgi:hypothetical protein|nr:hypothetical protein [Streptosporangiaceae bacterium]
MNDDQLTTAVRQSVSGVHMSVPAEDIISRARTIRARRRIPAAAAALTVAAGAALAVALPSAPGHPAPAQLTAWTVARKPGGAVRVTIREMRDPAGLQARLRADGIPATIRFASQNLRPSQLPRPCLYYRLPDREIARLTLRIFAQSPHASGETALTIHRSAIPARVGLWINVRPPAGHGPGGGVFSADLSLVYASGRCPSGKARIPTVGVGVGVVGGLSGGR